MTSIGKFIIVAGVLLVVLGAALWVLGKLGFRGLPGDIAYESSETRIDFPIVVSIVLTILINLVLWIMRWFGKQRIFRSGVPDICGRFPICEPCGFTIR